MGSGRRRGSRPRRCRSPRPRHGSSRRGARACSQLLEDEHGGRLGHHEAVALGVERPRRAGGLVVSLRERAHRAEPGHRDRGHRRLRAAADHHVGAAQADRVDARRRAPCSRPRTPCSGEQRTARPELDRHPAGSKVRKRLHDRERTHPVGARLARCRTQSSNDATPPSALPTAAPTRSAVPRDVEAGSLLRLSGRRDDEMGTAVHPPRRLASTYSCDVELLDLAGEARRMAARIEAGDRCGAATPGQQRLPGRPQPCCRSGSRARARSRRPAEIQQTREHPTRAGSPTDESAPATDRRPRPTAGRALRPLSGLSHLRSACLHLHSPDFRCPGRRASLRAPTPRHSPDPSSHFQSVKDQRARGAARAGQGSAADRLLLGDQDPHDGAGRSDLRLPRPQRQPVSRGLRRLPHVPGRDGDPVPRPHLPAVGLLARRDDGRGVRDDGGRRPARRVRRSVHRLDRVLRDHARRRLRHLVPERGNAVDQERLRAGGARSSTGPPCSRPSRWELPPEIWRRTPQASDS